jgi:hypothetical protein
LRYRQPNRAGRRAAVLAQDWYVGEPRRRVVRVVAGLRVGLTVFGDVEEAGGGEYGRVRGKGRAGLSEEF